MDKKEIAEALKRVKDISQKRNFKQKVDLSIKLNDLDLKNPENHLNLFVPLHFTIGKGITVCGLVGPELLEQSKANFDNTILVDDFAEFAKDAKKCKKLASKYNYFVAQANIMPKVASAFGRVLGIRGKMPNPKAGCVVPPAANLKPLYEKLQKTVKVIVKSSPVVQCCVGSEDLPDEEVIDNISNIYDNIIHHLPGEKNNIKNVIVKLTMGPAIVIGKTDKDAAGKESEKARKKDKKAEEKPAEVPKEDAKPEEKKAEEKPAKDIKAEEKKEEKAE